MIRRFLKPFVRSIHGWIWFLGVLVVAAWIGESLFTQSDAVAKYITPAALVALLLTWFLKRRWWRLPDPQNRTTRIVIVGAGPAGLSAAHFLKQQGYREVLVLEKLGRVGGLCRTITEDYHSFDLGANYLTPAYKETLALAHEVEADLYVERPIMTINFNVDPGEDPVFAKPWETVREGMSSLKYISLCLKYLWLRFRLRRIVDPPGHEHIHLHPDLCVSFATWLERHQLSPLERLFEAPITVMGYGYLHEIPAPYALKYMSVRTFMAMALKAFPLTSRFYWWPKRFVAGFQRLWEAVSWDLNVRCNVTIHAIRREGEKVQVEFSHLEQVLNETEIHRDLMEFDKLILACPLTEDVLGFVQDLSDEERELFGAIRTISYCLTSFTTEGIKMERPIAAALPLPEIGMPWAITKQMPDSHLFQFYSRVPQGLLPGEESFATQIDDSSDDPVREEIVGIVRDVVKRLGGKVQDDQWHTYDRWPYFQHVTAEQMKAGYYQRLEALQGARNTYFTGAIMNFELVESSVQYSKHLVHQHFPRVH